MATAKEIYDAARTVEAASANWPDGITAYINVFDVPNEVIDELSQLRPPTREHACVSAHFGPAQAYRSVYFQFGHVEVNCLGVSRPATEEERAKVESLPPKPSNFMCTTKRSPPPSVEP